MRMMKQEKRKTNPNDESAENGGDSTQKTTAIQYTKTPKNIILTLIACYTR